MEKKGSFFKSFIVYFAGLAVVFAILWGIGIIPKVIWAMVGLVFIAALSAALLSFIKPLGGADDEKQEPAAKDQAQQSPLELAARQGLENLVRLNLKARESALDDDLLLSLEQLIDRLFDILPRLNEQHRGSELAYVVNKIAGEYLGQITGSYFSLSVEARTGQKAELSRLLSGLNAEVSEIIKIVDDQATGEFKTHAKFISTKFFGETVEA